MKSNIKRIYTPSILFILHTDSQWRLLFTGVNELTDKSTYTIQCVRIQDHQDRSKDFFSITFHMRLKVRRNWQSERGSKSRIVAYSIYVEEESHWH